VSPILRYESVESIDVGKKTIHGREYDFILWAAGPQEVLSNQVRQVKLQSWQGAILHEPGPFEATYADCDDGYILQDKLGRTLGSLFKNDSERASTAKLKSLLLQKSPGFEAEGASVWEANRAATVDRLPVCGPVYQSRRGQAQPEFTTFEKYLSSLTAFPGVYQLQGLGSRGLSLAPLLGDSLVCMITGQSSSLSQPLLEAVHPARFSYRDLKRGKR
jgi:glycine/D-amino acid oxidase-like deaminating enzyme